jgi:hypothetical protein
MKKIGKPPLLWKGIGGPMKGSSIIMAARDQGGRGKQKGRKNRDDNAGVLYEMEWWVMRRREKKVNSTVYIVQMHDEKENI